MNDEGREVAYGPVAWREDRARPAPIFPEAWCGPVDLGAYEGEVPHTFYRVLGAARGWPIATVAYHGRSRTWCCGCPAGYRADAPCDHVRAVAYWVEVARLRREFLALSEGELREAWGRVARRVRAIAEGRVAAGSDWEARAAALFEALVRRGLATAGPDPVCELVAQLTATAAA